MAIRHGSQRDGFGVRNDTFPEAKLNTAAEATPLEAAFKAMALENASVAAPLFDEAIGSDLEAASSEALHQYGVALAWIGRLDDAERVLRLAFSKGPNAFLAYRLGSVLTEQRRFSEASTVFATIDRPQSWLAGGSIRSIWLPERKDELGTLDVPFPRTVNSLFDGSAGDRDFVYFVAADSRYAKQFARPLHSSLAAVSANCLLHIHVINPDAATSRLLDYIKQRPGPMTVTSSEKVELSGLSDDQRRVYYASARFFALSALRRHYDKPVIAADIDQVVLRDPASLIDPASDVAAIRFSYGRFNLLARFSASVIIASTLAAATYFDRVAAYLCHRMRDLRAIAWHLDQIALDVAHLLSDDIVLSELPNGAMLSAAPGADIPDETYFWSVTYSIMGNDRKLTNPVFQKLETVSLIVVTSIFDQSEGLERTTASVARDRFSNVAHILIDRRSAVRRLEAVANTDTNAFADLIRRMPKAIFVDLPCGQELGPQTLLEIMAGVESLGSRLPLPSSGAGIIDLPAGVGLGSKGERLTVYRRAEWTDNPSRIKVLVGPQAMSLNCL